MLWRLRPKSARLLEGTGDIIWHTKRAQLHQGERCKHNSLDVRDHKTKMWSCIYRVCTLLVSIHLFNRSKQDTGSYVLQFSPGTGPRNLSRKARTVPPNDQAAKGAHKMLFRVSRLKLRSGHICSSSAVRQAASHCIARLNYAFLLFRFFFTLP